jgi:hypothetical protein
MNRFTTALAAALFCAAAGVAYAQAPSGDAPKGPGMMAHEGHRMMKPCSQEADPAKCEANRKQMRENFKAAHEACKDKPDRHACMVEQYCSKQANPAECKERAGKMKERMSRHMDERQAAAEACTGKRGDALQACLREQHEKNHQNHAKPGDKKG